MCIDASVVLKLLVVEEDSHHARALWRSWARAGIQPVAPALLLFECVSAMRRLVSRGTVTERIALTALDLLLQMPIAFPVPEGLVKWTWEIAGRFGRPQAYGSFYLALAQLLEVPFWTADRRLFNAVRHKLPWVHLLGQRG